MFARASALTLLVACWTSETNPVTAPTKPIATTPARRATVRIDAQPGGKKFQGVWLEFSADQRWVVDYRPRELWKPFENREVLVTGECYVPFGQALMATHFRVDHMKFVTPERGRGPLLELHAEQMLRGSFVTHQFPEGSKRADSPALTFRADDGTEYFLAGASQELPAAGTVARIKAREVTPDMSWMAQPGGRKLWILDVRGPDDVDDPAHAPTIVPCP
jgi:hypothetical protein